MTSAKGASACAGDRVEVRAEASGVQSTGDAMLCVQRGAKEECRLLEARA